LSLPHPSPDPRLGARLTAVAGFVPEGAIVADVGADHGHLVLALAERGHRCVATEVRRGPFEVLRANLALADRGAMVDARFGDGLAPIAAGEVDVVCAAGIGGATIAGILERGHTVLGSVQRLILQPMAGEWQLRRRLIALGWALVREELVEDGGYAYEILVAEPGEPLGAYRDGPLPFEVALRVGPLVGPTAHPALLTRWRDRLRRLRVQRTRLPAADTEAIQRAAERLEREADELTTWLRWCEGK